MNSRQEQFFFKIHRDNSQEGPGNFESTKKAFSMLESLPESLNILDIGCGPGRQTLDLAKLSPGLICAIDTHDGYLKNLKKTSKERD